MGHRQADQAALFYELSLVLYLFRVQCSANRSGDPIVAGKRPHRDAIDYSEVQGRIEIAHRPLIEINDAAGR